MENKHFYVKRISTASSVTLTLSDHPRIKAKGQSQSDAEDALLDLICERFGDGEPVLQYEDVETGETGDARCLWTFSAQERLTTINISGLFPKGLCARCRNVIGGLARTGALPRRFLESSDHAVAFTLTGNDTTQLLSAQLGELLLELGLEPDVLVPAEDRSGRRFWEIQPTSNPVPYVPVKSSIAVKVGAMRCPDCGFCRFGYFGKLDKEIRSYILASSWQRGSRPIQVAGPFSPRLCFSASIKEKIQKIARWKGLFWHKTGLAAESEVDRRLKYNLYPKAKC